MEINYYYHTIYNINFIVSNKIRLNRVDFSSMDSNSSKSFSDEEELESIEYGKSCKSLFCDKTFSSAEDAMKNDK